MEKGSKKSYDETKKEAIEKLRFLREGFEKRIKAMEANYNGLRKDVDEVKEDMRVLKDLYTKLEKTIPKEIASLRDYIEKILGAQEEMADKKISDAKADILVDFGKIIEEVFENRTSH